MKRCSQANIAFSLQWVCGTVLAASTSAASPGASTTVDLVKTALGLAIVLAAIFACAWLARRVRDGAPSTRALVRVISQVILGSKQRLALVEVGENWILVGVTPAQISVLHVLPKEVAPDVIGARNQSSFAQIFQRSRARQE
jgi:flagellar protein FliO/FliZ